MFERNDIQLVGAGLAGQGDKFVSAGIADIVFDDITPVPAGNDNTRGFEGIASGLYDRFSISVGAFHYDTDGWSGRYSVSGELQSHCHGTRGKTHEAGLKVRCIEHRRGP